MDIQNLAVLTNGLSKKNKGAVRQPLTGIGKRGQIVEGMISKVSNRVSIRFNGIEVSVPGSAVSNARAGETRKFQIKDISEDSIVLKEAGARVEAKAVATGTTDKTDTGTYSFAECIEKSSDVMVAKEDAAQKIALVNGDEYAALEEEEGSLTDKSQEYLERAVEKMKVRNEWTEQKLEERKETNEKVQEMMKKIQSQGFLNQKSEGQLRAQMEEAGIPVTEENLHKILSAMEMGKEAVNVDDSVRDYLVRQNVTPTINNLYQGKHTMSRPAVVTEKTEQEFKDYLPHIERVLASCQRETPEDMANAKWLFANELPVNAETLSVMESLDYIGENVTVDKLFDQILYAMSAGTQAKDAVLDDRMFVVAREVVHDFSMIQDGTILKAAGLVAEAQKEAVNKEDGQKQAPVVNLDLLKQIQKESEGSSNASSSVNVPLKYTQNMSDIDIHAVTMKRQLEEIRQKMTVQVAVSMERKGIHIEMEPLNEVIRELRNIENQYYRSQMGVDGDKISDAQMNLMRETIAKTQTIADAHAGILGAGIRKHDLLTMNELHDAAKTAQPGNNVQYREWEKAYEKVRTSVRTDLGDSIQKAFSGIPEMLEKMGMENNDANQRAVRILGYNSMEVTEENIQKVKNFDFKINQIISNVKPMTVLELMRTGKNPLTIPIDELDAELKKISEDRNVSSEEKYSRFLWQLEKDKQISPEERSGYIGIYRLLNQIERSDGAPIGAVLEAKQEMTLGNLLTQSRIMNGNGVDIKIDDTTGFHEPVSSKKSISEQIDDGFSESFLREQKLQVENNKAEAKGITPKQADMQNGLTPDILPKDMEKGQDSQSEADMQNQETQTYYQDVLHESMEEMSPSKLKQMSDGDMEKLLNMSVETFLQNLRGAKGNSEIRKMYYENQADVLRETLSDSSEAEEYLAKLELPDTVENVIAVKNVLEEGFSPYKEMEKRKSSFTKEEADDWDETVDSILENVDDKDVLAEKCEKAEKFMENVLAKSREKADITFEDLSQLRMLSQGIRLGKAMRSRENYDIPIKTGDTITSLNLTIIHGAKASGKVQIYMQSEELGNVSLDFQLSGKRLMGMVLSDDRQGFETLRSQKGVLSENLTTAGFKVANISYGMDFRTRSESLGQTGSQEESDTALLYQAAKILVRSVVVAAKTE